ncbi:MAG: replication initiation protein RepC, partial [Yoonia sp.]|nr:replication initiation protein RepC [Yoonia sp.]
VNKYEILRELTVARKQMGITDRELAVLQALLSFHPNTVLGGNADVLLVYPSNAAICERLNGMPCSTMRRHLAGLVDTGLILRRDSPNGKRFVRRHGGDQQAFGFDLTPLLARQPEICAAAEQTRAAEHSYQRLRRAVSLMRRDLAGLAQFGQQTRAEAPVWAQFLDLAASTARALRRTLATAELTALESRLGAALDQARDIFEGNLTVNPGTNDVHIEQHHQNSNKEAYDLEPCLEKAMAEPDDPDRTVNPDERKLPNIPIGMVLSVCTEIHTYVPDGIRHWHQLVRAAETVRPMMGISVSAWNDAIVAMGAEEAAVVVIAMLERFNDIQSPGGYLRHLTRKAEDGAFSCGPMIMALMRREAA